MITIPVRLGERSYDVTVGRGAVATLGRRLGAFARAKTVLVASHRVHALHGARVREALSCLGSVEVVLMADGERAKTRATLARIHDAFLEARLGRDGLVVALGGGVVGDVTGFAAATWMRGLSWAVVPTTLLAMVDSAVGGKTAINHPKAKNMIGAFHQPSAVVVDPDVLSTLPLRELRGGAYEALKSGLIGDRRLFDLMAEAPEGLVDWNDRGIDGAITGSCRIKAGVVSRDEREGGLRRVLNLGHTLGHAYEAVTSFKRFTHGEAVGWGLLGSAALARNLGKLSARNFDAIAAAVDRIGPRPRVADLSPEALLAAVGHDKKARGGQVPFVLPTALGKVTIIDAVEASAVRAVIDELARRPHR